MIAGNAILECHPETYSQAVHRIEVAARRMKGSTLALTYVLTGDIGRLRVPPRQSPRRADRLWEHTCCEAFVSVQGGLAYYEFNFAPSGEWAAYAFRCYRDAMPLVDEGFDPKITVQTADGRVVLGATMRLDCLGMIQSDALLRLGLSVVVEDENGVLSYWALKHPPGKPDFHHRDTFALELVAPAVDAAKDPAYTDKE